MLRRGQPQLFLPRRACVNRVVSGKFDGADGSKSRTDAVSLGFHRQ